MTAAGTGALVLVTRKIVKKYVPLADDWAIIAHSHPDFAEPQSWFTKGFRDYFMPPAGLPAVGGAAFIRPVFNLTYWLCGLFSPPDSGRQLYVNYAAIGACGGLTSLAITRAGGSQRTAVLMGSAAPLMPALAPALSPLVYPCMGFDAVAADIGLAAFLAFEADQPALAAGLLLIAVFTKETVLPTAAALPALFAMRSGRRLWREKSLFTTLAMLSAPAVLWFAARLAAFSRAELAGAYVLDDDPRGRVLRQLRIASKWPFSVETSTLVREPGLSRDKVAVPPLLVANALTMGGALFQILTRVRRRELPAAEEVCFLSSYGFLQVAGTSQRYGVGLDAFLLICLARWAREQRAPSWPRGMVSAGVALGLAVTALQAVHRYRRLEANVLRYGVVGRKYIAALAKFDASDTVVVLNDPVTWWMPVKWMARVMRIRANVVKVADYPWSRDMLDAIRAPCEVRLHPPENSASPFRFTQSCGIDILSSRARLPDERQVRVDYGDGLTIELESPTAASMPASKHVGRWQEMRIFTGRKPVHLLYYDPRQETFRSVFVDASPDG